jgi:hypothetical protein
MATRTDPDRAGSNVRRKQADLRQNISGRDFRAGASLMRETRARNKAQRARGDAEIPEELFAQFTVQQLAEIRAVTGAQLAKQVQAKRSAEAAKNGRANQPASQQQPTAAQRAQGTKENESLKARAKVAEERSPATAAALRGEQFTGEQQPVLGHQASEDAMSIFKQMFADRRAAEAAKKGKK